MTTYKGKSKFKLDVSGVLSRLAAKRRAEEEAKQAKQKNKQ